MEYDDEIMQTHVTVSLALICFALFYSSYKCIDELFGCAIYDLSTKLLSGCIIH